ncbi:MAG: ion transporter [Spirochaetes bacterium]|nr:ion transporter [Spirochaetota bacterium]
MSKKRHPVVAVLEDFVLLVILASIVQIFLDDLAVALGRGRAWRDPLLLAGLAIDAVFSVEFIARAAGALAGRRFRRYFIVERGWVDLLCSLPLLAFNSGPAAWTLLAGSAATGGLAAIVKSLRVVKAVRVSRVLRLIRILKIFGRIQNADSRMAQRHVSNAAMIGIFSVVLVIVVLSATGTIGVDTLAAHRVAACERSLAAIGPLAAETGSSVANAALSVFGDNPDVALVAFNPSSPRPEILVGQGTLAALEASLPAGSWALARSGPLGAVVLLGDLEAIRARYDLAFFAIIMTSTILFLVVYARTFAQGVSDVVYVISRGIRERDYNLRVRIDPDRADEELLEFALFYNDVFLPAKRRRDADRAERSRIKLDDLAGF